jgi:hypothetical protein
MHYGFFAPPPRMEVNSPPRLEALSISEGGHCFDAIQREIRGRDHPRIRRNTVLSCQDRPNLSKSLPSRWEIGVRNHLDRVAGTGSRVSCSLIFDADLGLIRISQCQHVALKLYIQSESLGSELDTELDVYRRIENTPKDHPGRSAVRSLIDSFELETPSGRHRCLIHTPLWESALNIKNRNSIRRLPPPVMAFLLKRLFLALELLHRECHLVHTDIKEANILLPADASVLTQFENQELNEPSPKKEVDGSVIYLSRKMGTPKAFGAPVLCDFGSAVPLDDGLEHREDIQPDVYRAPEVILDIPWTYSVDIWNVGCMVSGYQR